MLSFLPLLFLSTSAQYLLSASSSSTLLELQPAVYQSSIESPDNQVEWGCAKRIWVDDSYAAGPFTFHATFLLTSQAMAEMRSVKLRVVVDDEFRVTVNGRKLVREWVNGLRGVELELRPWVVGYEEGGENVLEIEALNTEGPGTLAYAVIGYT